MDGRVIFFCKDKVFQDQDIIKRRLVIISIHGYSLSLYFKLRLLYSLSSVSCTSDSGCWSMLIFTLPSMYGSQENSGFFHTSHYTICLSIKGRKEFMNVQIKFIAFIKRF